MRQFINKIVFGFFAGLASLTGASAQKNKADTLDYLQTQIVDKKETYLNQPLDVLLRDLKMKVVCYMAHPGRPKEISPGISLYFMDINEVRDRIAHHQRVPDLWINWQSPVAWDTAAALIRKEHGNWSAPVQEFYGKLIVKDILITRKK